MSYSSVPSQDAIRTRVAVSGDMGATWTFVAEANQPQAITVDTTETARCGGATCSGNLIHEVSSLVLDATDPNANRRWKLFTHSYLHIPPSDIAYNYGFIALATAPEPWGPWSTQQKLLGWASPTSLSSTGAAMLLSAWPQLQDCVTLTEPTALAVADGSLYLATGCVYVGTEVGIRVELFRSTDHAATFSPVGTLMGDAAARCLGNSQPRVNAPNLMVVGGQVYLSVTRDMPPPLLYQGCDIVPVADLQAASLVLNGAAPALVRRLVVANNGFSGACTYAEGASAAGYLMDVGFFSTPRPFRIMASGVAAP